MHLRTSDVYNHILAWQQACTTAAQWNVVVVHTSNFHIHLFLTAVFFSRLESLLQCTILKPLNSKINIEASVNWFALEIFLDIGLQCAIVLYCPNAAVSHLQALV